MTYFKTSLLAAAGLAALSGCTIPAQKEAPTALRTEVSQRAQERQALPSVIAPVARVVEDDKVRIPVVTRKVSEHSWLREKRVTVQTGRDPVPMSEVLRALSRQGISITAELPLDRFSYSGFSLVDIDAESALRAITSSVGLDYQVNGDLKLVTIKPMSSRTWYLNIGNRQSSFAAGGSSVGNVATNGVANALAAQAGGGGGDTGGGSAGNTSTSEVTSRDDFWTSLATELEARLQLMLPEPPSAATNTPTPAALPLPGTPIPVPPPPNTATPAGGASSAPSASATASTPAPAVAPAPTSAVARSADGILNYTSRQVGSFSLNPETGAITVQAPHWVLGDLDGYFKRVQDMYNTDITFQGELIMLSTDASRSEGLDIAAFARFANAKYGVTFRNNGLGGVTVSLPGNGPASITTGPGALAGPVLGLTGVADGLQIFNGYLTNMGRVTTLQRPVLTTTSGVPADFRRTVTRYFNTVSQETASGGTGSAAVGTQNQLVPQEFGTVLRVNPRIDISTGLIRAQIELVQTTQTGSQTVSQSVSSGNSVVQIPTQLPVVSRMVYSGEALLRDGDLVVMGGQTEEMENNNRDGITGLMDSPGVSGLFGRQQRESSRNVFYFALRVNVNKR